MPHPVWSRAELERIVAAVLGLAVAALLGAAVMACAAHSAYGSTSLAAFRAHGAAVPAHPEAGVPAGSSYAAVLEVKTAPPPRPLATSTVTTVVATEGRVAAPPPAPAPRGASASVAATGMAFGCQAAIAYLIAHAAPGFRFVCPGYAMGHQAMTCHNMAGICPGEDLIVIADPCPAAYENEAWNSLLAVGLVSGRVDPYGSCP